MTPERSEAKRHDKATGGSSACMLPACEQFYEDNADRSEVVLLSKCSGSMSQVRYASVQRLLRTSRKKEECSQQEGEGLE